MNNISVERSFTLYCQTTTQPLPLVSDLPTSCDVVIIGEDASVRRGKTAESEQERVIPV
jgi:hypothetical protein